MVRANATQNAQQKNTEAEVGQARAVPGEQARLGHNREAAIAGLAWWTQQTALHPIAAGAAALQRGANPTLPRCPRPVFVRAEAAADQAC